MQPRTPSWVPRHARAPSRTSRSSSPSRPPVRPIGFSLASGMASSIHGDVFIAWDNAALGHRVKDCIVQKAKCNTAGTF